MHSGDTQAQRTEKLLSIPSASLFMEALFQLNLKKALHLPSLISLLPSFSYLKGEIMQSIFSFVDLY